MGKAWTLENQFLLPDPSEIAVLGLSWGTRGDGNIKKGSRWFREAHPPPLGKISHGLPHALGQAVLRPGAEQAMVYVVHSSAGQSCGH